MSDLTPLPGAMDVRDVLGGLIARDVQVTTGGSMVDPAAEFGALVGVYVDRHGVLGALVLMDLELAARSGAAIALLPTPTSERAIGAGLLPDTLIENASEILNVLASLFNNEEAPHLKLGDVYAPGDPVPNDVARWLTAFVRRSDLDVDIKGYGSGRFSLIVL